MFGGGALGVVESTVTTSRITARTRARLAAWAAVRASSMPTRNSATVTAAMARSLR